MKRWGWVLTVAIGTWDAGRGLAADSYAAQNGQNPAWPHAGWSTAASNIQDAVNAAGINDTVWIGKGRYVASDAPSNALGTSVVALTRPMTLRSSNGEPESVVIDGGGLYRGVSIYALASTPNLYVLDGLTVSNGWATNYGGGVSIAPYVTYVMTTRVQNCIITHNRAYNLGGGLSISRATTVSNCTIRYNTVTNDPDSPTPSSSGGGLYITYPTTLADCRIYGNQCLGASNDLNRGGSGLHINRTQVTLRNALIAHNSGNPSYCGYGLWCFVGSGAPTDECTVNLVNSVIAGHTTGGGVRARRSNWTLNVLNSIVYSNTPVNFDGNASTLETNLFMTYSCSPKSGLTGIYDASNVTNWPAFVNLAGGDLRLTAESPCINRGTNQNWMRGAPDLDGHSRLDRFSGIVDMGPYEYVPRGVLLKGR